METLKKFFRFILLYDLLIAPIWNGNACIKAVNNSVSGLLIAPIWNGNALILKIAEKQRILLIAPIWNGNPSVRVNLIVGKTSFNRTNLEWKHAGQAAHQNTGACLLIAPIWNGNPEACAKLPQRSAGLLIAPIWNGNSQYKALCEKLVSDF